MAEILATEPTVKELVVVSRAKVQALAETIVEMARKQAGETGEKPKWSELSTGRVELSSAIALGEIREQYPELVQVLETPVDEFERKHNTVDDGSMIQSVGFFRRPSGPAVEFCLNDRGNREGRITRVGLEVTHNGAIRTWEVSFDRNDRYTPYGKRGGLYQEGEQGEIFKKALDQSNQLVAEIAAGGHCNSSYEKVKMVSYSPELQERKTGKPR